MVDAEKPGRRSSWPAAHGMGGGTSTRIGVGGGVEARCCARHGGGWTRHKRRRRLEDADPDGGTLTGRRTRRGAVGRGGRGSVRLPMDRGAGRATPAGGLDRAEREPRRSAAQRATMGVIGSGQPRAAGVRAAQWGPLGQAEVGVAKGVGSTPVDESTRRERGRVQPTEERRRDAAPRETEEEGSGDVGRYCFAGTQRCTCWGLSHTGRAAVVHEAMEISGRR
ncbi:proline-rich receptor-like protein kinase PERK2 [Iris pallida]|uniref:Proline-rich receptor-like protein kinase PERK2 n=1 Tax=Iris pallida TaxID=29817 RepID=A0AAX6EF49_IRIPA|nr:proline-rich receptor-like protein kinase PERK2 [Iris pallida]